MHFYTAQLLKFRCKTIYTLLIKNNIHISPEIRVFLVCFKFVVDLKIKLNYTLTLSYFSYIDMRI